MQCHKDVDYEQVCLCGSSTIAQCDVLCCVSKMFVNTS